MKHLLLVIALFASQFVVAQTAEKTGSDSTWTTFKTDDYLIDHPLSWTIDTSRKMGIELFIFSPPDSVNDKFRENINVVSSDVEGLNISLDTFVKVSQKQIETIATDCIILESALYKSGDKIFHKLDFTAKQGVFHLRFVQYYFAKSKRVYTVTLTTELKNFDNYKFNGIKIMDSFIPLQ